MLKLLIFTTSDSLSIFSHCVKTLISCKALTVPHDCLLVIIQAISMWLHKSKSDANPYSEMTASSWRDANKFRGSQRSVMNLCINHLYMANWLMNLCINHLYMANWLDKSIYRLKNHNQYSGNISLILTLSTNISYMCVTGCFWTLTEG